RPGRSAQRFRRFSAAMVSARSRLAALIAFALLVAFLGGSSRPDAPGLIALRPLAVLFCLYGLLAATDEHLRSARAALLLVGAVMLLALAQLVPLPPGVWRALPGRELVSEALALIGSGADWRPLSLDPNRTWNAFFALFVPFATICLVAAQEPRWQEKLPTILLGIGLLSAALGYLQALGGNGLHLYEITHRGFPVGMFANKNHQAILLLWLIFASSFIAATADPRQYSANASTGAM